MWWIFRWRHGKFIKIIRFGSLNFTNTISKYEWILIKFSVGCHLFHSTNTLVQHFSCFAVVLLLFTRLLWWPQASHKHYIDILTWIEVKYQALRLEAVPNDCNMQFQSYSYCECIFHLCRSRIRNPIARHVLGDLLPICRILGILGLR